MSTHPKVKAYIEQVFDLVRGMGIACADEILPYLGGASRLSRAHRAEVAKIAVKEFEKNADTLMPVIRFEDTPDVRRLLVCAFEESFEAHLLKLDGEAREGSTILPFRPRSTVKREGA